MNRWIPSALLLLSVAGDAQTPDWPKINQETFRHYQTLIQMDTTDPPGNEAKAVEYIKGVLEAEGIPVIIAAQDPNRANLIARIKGNGSKKPFLIMGHTDTVKVDTPKWILPPFSAARKDGYVYGRGTQDDKDNLTAGLMTMLMLKRSGIPLDRDVIFVAEAGEEGASSVGIGYLVNQHWKDIEAETCLAEAGNVIRRDGKVMYALIQTAEKVPQGARLVAKGPAGHASRPLRGNAVVHLSRAVEKVALWEPPMKLNDTTRYYFEKLGTVGTAEEKARYSAIFNPQRSAAALEYLAEHEPANYSMLHTSISPTIIKGGYQSNVIPSDAEANLDIRALPDEDMPAFFELMRKVIDDPAVEIVPGGRGQRSRPQPSRIDSEAFHVIEAANQKVYQTITVPQMGTGATDMSALRGKGMQCYGIGPILDEEDAPRGFGAHSDQERILEEGLYKFVQFNWEVATALAASKR